MFVLSMAVLTLVCQDRQDRADQHELEDKLATQDRADQHEMEDKVDDDGHQTLAVQANEALEL